ncbi:MAG TPA: SOS response-associated peptidase [Candidatus Marinimicrobia bacterium]|nr:SOS response-associated peptidase [Candidatus Neomarinimicrobiota bacterium]
MCGRFALDFKREVIIEELEGGKWFEYRYPLDLPRYNVAPLQFAPVLFREDKRYMIDAFRWGLTPKWAKDESYASRMINARLETLCEKPAYRNLTEHHRCVILSSGYFEWQKTQNSKRPWYITASHSSVLPLAGLWDVWTRPEQSPLYTFTIITKNADNQISFIHDRMPLILNQKILKPWLDGSIPINDPAVIVKDMAFYPVSQIVNNAQNDVPACVERMQST